MVEPNTGQEVCNRQTNEKQLEGEGSSGTQISISELFFRSRWPTSLLKRFILLLYTPFGTALFIFRICIGIHVFVTTCILRKTMLLRCAVVEYVHCFVVNNCIILVNALQDNNVKVLRVMSSILGLVVLSRGPAKGWDKKTKLIVANHVTTLDHIAIDLIEPCILPSVWDIPDILRWLLGYADLGAREGRSVLVRKAREFCECDSLPLLAFPEGAMTNGKKGLLKFSSWPFEVSDVVQPVLITVYRPLFGSLTPSVLGGSWWQDVFYFLFVPFTIIKVTWLPPMRRQKVTESGECETADSFAKRVADVMASQLGIAATSLTFNDAVDEAKRHLQNRRRLAERATLALNNTVSSRSFLNRNAKPSSAHLDNIAMRIKQAFPSLSLMAIRDDLDITLDGNLTCERIAQGLIKEFSEQMLNDVEKEKSLFDNESNWRNLYNFRKWQLIERNRAKYLQRMRNEDVEVPELQ
uniref:CUE domain-containing protein n=1 Tax=Syphacia muris TaxID=451379 RepID=A0A0N5ABZ0_9BILA